MENHRGHYIDFNVLGNRGVVIDAGACRGDFARFISKHGRFEIYGIEPCLRNFKTIQNNKIYKKVFNRVLIGKHDEDFLEFYDYLNYVGRGSILDRHNDRRYPNLKKFNTYDVEVIRINALFDFLGVEKVDYFKLDVEAAEHDIFNEITEENIQKIKQLSMEMHPITNDDRSIDDLVSEMVILLENFGFTVKFFEKEREIWAVNRRLRV